MQSTQILRNTASYSLPVMHDETSSNHSQLVEKIVGMKDKSVEIRKAAPNYWTVECAVILCIEIWVVIGNTAVEPFQAEDRDRNQN
ncbi:unnamed protein product [Brugia pahangi]|uniref:Uncharacterized protein n=1 Tax=Brugia pahangi TaxID=6280 RepID=A0A0N4TSE0_BRUPA|nr:unnamed protein product [Brugia pahangi]